MRDGPMRLTKRATITIRSDAPNASDASHVVKSRHTSTGIFLKLLAVSVLALGVANCSSATRSGGSAKVDPKYGVKPSPRVVANGKPVPKGGGRSMVGKPYVVAGKTFTPKEADDYVAIGTASWYGSDFHGRKTANGEIFDKQSIAAAHPTLPLPSYVRVTNLSNQRSMVVRVNDRGPFHGNRLIDLSKSAAEALDFHRQGTARVKVEYVGRASLTGSDDRKLLATLNAGQPAPIPTAAPAPVMVASAEPVAPVVEAPVQTPAPVAEVPVEAPAQPHVSRTLMAQSVPEPAAAPMQVATLQRPVAASLAPAPHAMPYAQQPATSSLTELVREVNEPQARTTVASAPTEALGAVMAAPMPPARPVDLAPRRRLMGPIAAAAPAQEAGRRSLVAGLPFAAANKSEQKDADGAFFEPMPLSQLTPQRFVTVGTGAGRQKSDR